MPTLGEIDALRGNRIDAELAADIRYGMLRASSITDEPFAGARHRAGRLGEMPRRALDVLHSAMARDTRAEAAAAAAPGFTVFRFHRFF